MHALLVVTLLACGADDAPPPTPAPAAATKVVEDDAPDIGPRRTDAGAQVTAPDQILVPGPTEVPNTAPARIAARHILVAWKGAVGADPALRRSKREALARAQEIRQRVVGGEDFAAVAREVTDGPSAPRGGDLGAFGQGVMHKLFEARAFRLDIGEVSPVVETPFGFHVIRRDILDEVRVAHIVVQYAGATRTETAKRTPDEARARAGEARARLLAGEAVADVVRDVSEGAFASRGGDLGWFQRGNRSAPCDTRCAAPLGYAGSSVGVPRSPAAA